MRKLIVVLVFSAVICVSAIAQMVSPEIDKPGEPFSYFSRPTDVIGVMDAPAATLVSPEGFYYTGFGELMFFSGNPAEPINQRVKTLMRGYLPVIDYSYQRDGIEYRFMSFAATLDGTPEGTLVDFIRVRVTNRSGKPRVAWLGTAMRYQSDVNSPDGRQVADNRFARPAEASRKGEYRQLGERFSSDWTYAFTQDAFLRGDKLMYIFPTAPEHTLHLTMKEGYNESSDITARKLNVQPTTPMGFVQYRLPLKADEDVVLDFKLPVVPPAQNAPEVAAIRNANFHEYLGRTAAFWEEILGNGLEITVPEQKVTDAFKANLIYDLIARDKLGSDYVQTVNKFHYHAFWLRDSSFIARMYDLSGYPEYARQVLDFFAGWQQADGNFVSQGGQFDGWGQTMWAYGQHYRMTGDRAFAERVFPSVRKAVAWLKQARAADPLNLMPQTSPGDNEDITGHVTGHNFWALAGLKNAIALADGIGQKQDAADFRREYDDYLRTFRKVLEDRTKATNGFITPGLENEKGQDWGNMLSVYPEIILDPHDPMVTATLEGTRAKYQEGIMTYGDGRWLHHYLTFKNTETETIRGDQKWAVEELYAVLVHTSSTHAGFEFAIRPWGNRDFNLNLTPHGWFSAKFRAALRNMLVREQGNDLHLFSVVSPEWLKPGDQIVVKRAPTEFGTVEFTLQTPTLDHAVLEFSAEYRRKPEHLYLHLPWFVELQSATADGKPLKLASVLGLPPTTRHVELNWHRKANTPSLSYAKAVEDYKKEYRGRYEKFLETGENGVSGAKP